MLSNNKLWFILMSLILILLPLKLVWDQEKILENGKTYHFKLIPFDPTDPFRGKFITLRFAENQVYNSNDISFKIGEKAVAILSESNNYAQIIDLQKTAPNIGNNYLYVIIKSIDNQQITFDLPFNKYYFNESKTDSINNILQSSLENINADNYAVVIVKNGMGTLQTIYINNKNIKDYFK